MPALGCHDPIVFLSVPRAQSLVSSSFDFGIVLLVWALHAQ